MSKSQASLTGKKNFDTYFSQDQQQHEQFTPHGLSVFTNDYSQQKRRAVMGGAIGGNLLNVALTMVGGAMGGPIGMMVAQLAKQVIGAVMEKVIDQLPIPDEMKNLLQAAVQAGLGNTQGAIQNIQELIQNIGQAAGGSPTGIAGMQNDVSNFENEVRDMLTQLITQQGLDREGPDSGGGGSKPGTNRGNQGGAAGGGAAAGGAAGWLRAMAEALGKKLDDLAHEMQEAAENIDKEDPSTSVEFQVISQQFSILMNAASTALKSVGEAMAAVARKQ